MKKNTIRLLLVLIATIMAAIMLIDQAIELPNNLGYTAGVIGFFAALSLLFSIASEKKS